MKSPVESPVITNTAQVPHQKKRCSAGVLKPRQTGYWQPGYLPKELGLIESAAAQGLRLAFEDSGKGLKAAMPTDILTIETPNAFTAHHDFAGALRVLPSLEGGTVAG